MGGGADRGEISSQTRCSPPDTKQLHTMRTLAVLLLVTLAAVHAAPMEEALRSLQEQVAAMQKALESQPKAAESEPAYQKRMAAWQPMKRTVDERTPLLHAIEARLSEVLRAGERLGISAEEVLADLRSRNQFGTLA